MADTSDSDERIAAMNVPEDGDFAFVTDGQYRENIIDG